MRIPIYVTLLITTFFSTTLFSQTKGLSVGATIGAANYQGDLVDAPLFYLSETSFGAGIYGRYQFNDKFAARLQYSYGKLSGDDANHSNTELNNRGFSFTSTISEVAIMAEILPFSSDGSSINPYIFAGAGMNFFDATPISDGKAAGATLALFTDDLDALPNNESSFGIPIGVGIRFGLTDKIRLGAEIGFHATFSDYLDGISLSGNPDQNDWWSMGGLNIEYAISGGKDRDGDGVPDKDDKCPRDPGPKKLKGCPDSDEDGIIDRRDRCPQLAGPKDLNGCPDSDGDGVVDVDDKCPQSPGGKAMEGCPDRDGDGVTDMQDHCPNSAGLKSLNGCPDTDGDGVVDPNDKCPDQKGTFDNDGCPEN